MVRQDINTLTSLFPWQVKKQRWCRLVGGAMSFHYFLVICSSVGQKVSALPIDPEGMRRWWKKLCPPFAPETQPNRSRSGGRKIYGEDEDAVWYLTKAMAASSLQNSSSTITPSRRVMWSMLRWQTREWGASSKTAAEETSEKAQEHTYVMPSGSRPRSLFLTSSSLGVKSGIRWILIIRSPTTWHTSQKKKWEMPSCNTWQLLSVVVQLVTLNHAGCCFSYHIWCFTEEQTTTDNICVSVHHPADVPPACPCFWSKPWTLSYISLHPDSDLKGQKLQGKKKNKNKNKIITKSFNWQDCQLLPKV